MIDFLWHTVESVWFLVKLIGTFVLIGLLASWLFPDRPGHGLGTTDDSP